MTGLHPWSATRDDAYLNHLHGDGLIRHVRLFRTASVERPYRASLPDAASFRNPLIH
ncbi:hypothetical protein [Accumulibacter sp.]|uniref:hypothetical protein n=1 Tax=Accumulibacter sp. TaxID=2053492 RepID=UPI0025D14DBB|nr:hypothetical protein [Accumulibacter sp.]MCM8613796.1 hypothetical protein [Accumulibacter sp.]MCM8637462.1 hypothetical protein [Accumulibacter sp.]MCM8638451.1 hypothetical protein [Accumulibacter sp.]